MSPLIRAGVGACVWLVAACGKAPESSVSAAAPPADPKLAKLYAQTCKACHGAPGTGAPQTGDTKAWEPRVAQGMSVLVGHAVTGYKGMPPLGSCPDCSEQDFEALIRYMAGQAS